PRRSRFRSRSTDVVAYRRARRFIFRREAVVFFVTFFFATFFLRRGPIPIARFIAGVTCLTLARPTSRALLVDSSITSAADFATAPASIATDRTFSTPRCATSVIAFFAFVVTLLTIRCLSGMTFDNAEDACTVPKNRERQRKWRPSDQVD